MIRKLAKLVGLYTLTLGLVGAPMVIGAYRTNQVEESQKAKGLEKTLTEDERNFTTQSELPANVILESFAEKIEKENKPQEYQKPQEIPTEEKFVSEVSEYNQPIQPEKASDSKTKLKYSILNEDNILGYISGRQGIPFKVLKTVRKIENGESGREFGVIPTERYEQDNSDYAGEFLKECTGKDIKLSNKEKSRLNEYLKQGVWASETLKNIMKRGGRSNVETNGKLDTILVREIRDIYAPLGATNDPRGLNSEWASNFERIYKRIRLNEETRTYSNN